MRFRSDVAPGRTAGYGSSQMSARSQRQGQDVLDDRARRVLSAIVRDHIESGEPVGSHAIARRPEVDVSSATVRAVMADLEDLGYLSKPHTSAGRIPTQRGYRYYVDALLRVKQPLQKTRKTLKEDVQWAKERIA